MDDGSRRPLVNASGFFNGDGDEHRGESRTATTPSEPLRSANRMATRISDVLFRTREGSFSSIASFGSNADAVDAGLLFLNGVEKNVVVLGPDDFTVATTRNFQGDTTVCDLMTEFVENIPSGSIVLMVGGLYKYIHISS